MEKLKYNEIRKTGIEHLKFNETSMNLKAIKRFASRNSIDVDVFLKSKNMNLQRPLVWNIRQKQAFIVSFLQEAPIGVFTFVQYTKKPEAGLTGIFQNDVLKVLDGKQRLTTLLEFTNNGFPIVFKGNEYYFNDMEDKLQNFMLRQYLRINILYDYEVDPELTEDDYVRVFLYLNYAGETQSQEYLDDLNNMIGNEIAK